MDHRLCKHYGGEKHGQELCKGGESRHGCVSCCWSCPLRIPRAYKYLNGHTVPGCHKACSGPK